MNVVTHNSFFKESGPSTVFNESHTSKIITLKQASVDLLIFSDKQIQRSIKINLYEVSVVPEF